MAQKKSTAQKLSATARIARGVQKRERRTRTSKPDEPCYDVRFVYTPESTLSSPLDSPGSLVQATRAMGNVGAGPQEGLIPLPNYSGVPVSMVSRFSAAPLLSSDPSQIVPLKSTIVSGFKAKGPQAMKKYAFQLEVDSYGEEVRNDMAAPDIRSQEMPRTDIENLGANLTSFSPERPAFSPETLYNHKERAALRELVQREVPSPKRSFESRQTVTPDSSSHLCTTSLDSQGSHSAHMPSAELQARYPFMRSSSGISVTPELIGNQNQMSSDLPPLSSQGPVQSTLPYDGRPICQQRSPLSAIHDLVLPLVHTAHPQPRTNSPNEAENHNSDVSTLQPTHPQTPVPSQTCAYMQPQCSSVPPMSSFQPYQEGIPPWFPGVLHVPPRPPHSSYNLPNGFPMVTPHQSALYPLPHPSVIAQHPIPHPPLDVPYPFSHSHESASQGSQCTPFVPPNPYPGPIHPGSQHFIGHQIISTPLPHPGQPFFPYSLNHPVMPHHLPYPYPAQTPTQQVTSLPPWVYHPDLWSTTFEGVKRKTKEKKKKKRGKNAVDNDSSDEQRYQCPFCPRQFHRGNSLALHIKWHQEHARRLISQYPSYCSLLLA